MTARLSAVPAPDSVDDALRDVAVSAGCLPRWCDGIYGWAYHCTCKGNLHGASSQCSVLTPDSVTREER
jgi:hypothetical protein